MLTTEIIKETVVYFADCRRRLPGEPRFFTVKHWARRGRRGSDGSGVYHTLEWCRLPKGPATSIEAWERYVRRLNGELPPLADDVERSRKLQGRAES